MSAHFSRAIGGLGSRCIRRLPQRLRGGAKSTYSPALSLALLLAVGILVKFH